MDIKRIVVDELPECCSSCQFHIVLDYVGKDWCTAAKKTILEKITYKLISPSWCPLEVEEVCEWVEIEDGCFTTIHETGGLAPTNHEFTFCPDCGKRIKYVEVE